MADRVSQLTAASIRRARASPSTARFTASGWVPTKHVRSRRRLRGGHQRGQLFDEEDDEDEDDEEEQARLGRLARDEAKAGCRSRRRLRPTPRPTAATPSAAGAAAAWQTRIPLPSATSAAAPPAAAARRRSWRSWSWRRREKASLQRKARRATAIASAVRGGKVPWPRRRRVPLRDCGAAVQRRQRAAAAAAASQRGMGAGRGRLRRGRGRRRRRWRRAADDEGGGELDPQQRQPGWTTSVSVGRCRGRELRSGGGGG